MDAEKKEIIWHAAGYARLSDADEEKRRKGGEESSESIANQLLIIQNYVSSQPDVELVDTYVDDGFTGLNYNRSGYQKLMQDVDTGKVNMIITKSLSRLGREQAETLMLFKRDFILKGVRYVAVEDHIDFRDRIQDINIPFKTLMNDMYSMQISNDVRSAMRAKALEGKFIGSFAAYGYRKSLLDKNKLEVDPYAADVVRRIFKMFLDGYSIKGIMNTLNQEGILSPTMYKLYHDEQYYNSHRLEKTTYWTYATIRCILKRKLYTGDMVQHTKEKLAYNIEKVVPVPEEEHIVVENTHPAIIDHKTFEIAQGLLKNVNRTWKQGKIQKYAGFFFCGDCGRSMAKNWVKDDLKYRCGTYVKIGKEYCSSHLITGSELDYLLLMEIRKNVEAALSEKDFEQIENRQVRKAKRDIQKEIQELNIKKERLSQQKRQMLDKLSKGIITDEDYLIFKENCETNTLLVEKEITSCLNYRECDNIYDEEYKSWVENFLKYKNIQTIDRDVIVNLIESIRIYENGRIEIKFKFKNPFQNI